MEHVVPLSTSRDQHHRSGGSQQAVDHPGGGARRANIIFGAALDEKMKDSVKITGIATGFREIPQARNRHQETRYRLAAATKTRWSCRRLREA